MVAATWYLVMTSVLMVAQYYLERYFARGSSRTMSSRQLAALAKAQEQTLGSGA
jgi:polar amino acid transport system permease protein